MQRKSLALAIGTMVSLAFFACGGGGGGVSTTGNIGTSKLTVSGKLGDDYAIYKPSIWDFIIPKAFASYGIVNKIVAIHLVDGEHIEISLAKNIDVNSDGSFSAELEKMYNYQGNKYPIYWLLLLDKGNDNFEFIGISGSSGDSLINLPIGEIKTATLNLGTIQKSDLDEASTSLNLNTLAQNFNLNSTEVENLAKLDDIVKSAINIYINNYGKSEDEYIEPVLHVVSKGNYAKIKDDYALADNFVGYAFHIHGGKVSILSKNFEDICKGNKVLELIPPGKISTQNSEYDSDNPFKSSPAEITSMENGAKQCGATDFWMKKDPEDGFTVVNFLVGEDENLATTKPISNGWFILKLDDTEIAKFKFSYNLPLTKNGKYLKVPIPAIKLNVKDNGKVVGAYIKWYIYDEAINNFKEINGNYVKKIAKVFSIHMDDFNGLNGNNNRLEIKCDDLDLTKTYIDFTKECKNYKDIYYNYNGDDKYSLDDINVVINIIDNEYRFTYRKE
jgi:hypothetical protein